MANRFIGKTQLGGLKPIRLDGRPVQDQYALYRDLLIQTAGPQADIFAEPIATWREGSGDEGSIAWYADAVGEPEPLASLPLERRLTLETRLRATLAALQPALADARLGPWLRRALVLGSPDGVLAVGQNLILIDWGLSVAEPTGDAALEALAAVTLGRYMVQPTAVAPAAAYAAAPADAMREVVHAGPTPAAPRITSRSTVWNWWLVPAGAVVATVFLALGLWQGSRLVAARYATRPTTVNLLDETATRAAINRQNEQNAALEQEIEARQRALSGDVCVLDPAQLPRIGPDRAAAVPAAVVPPPPGSQQFSGSLADLLKQAVVLVIAPGSQGVESGSGFFVTPDLIVTNRHVVEDADAAKIMVTNETIGKLTTVEIVATTPSSDIGGPDIALLRVRNPPHIQPLSMTTTVALLDQVIAAGYPGLLLQADTAFDKLLHGDASAIPQVILTDGRINAIQPAASGIKIMPHSAAVSGGNSGGPLVDGCGRVVGINTFITANREQVAHANYAQKADSVISFLREHGAAVTEVSGPCTPGAPVPIAPPATPASAPGIPAAPAAPR